MLYKCKVNYSINDMQYRMHIYYYYYCDNEYYYQNNTMRLFNDFNFCSIRDQNYDRHQHFLTKYLFKTCTELQYGTIALFKAIALFQLGSAPVAQWSSPKRFI